MPIREYTNFAGGVNQQLGPVVSESKEYEAMFFAQDAENFEMSESGILKMPGYDNVLSSAVSGTPTVTGIFETFVSGSRELILCAGTKVFRVSGGSTTELYSGITADNFFFGTEFNGLLILCNGEDTPLEYNGTTVTTVTFTDPDSILDSATPIGCEVFRGSLFYWDETKIYKPRPGTHNNFDNSENTVDGFNVDPGFGGNITRLKALTDDTLIIYKERCIRRLSGSTPFGSGGDEFRIRPITDEVGCIAPRSVVQVGVEHYFLSQNGLRQLRPIDSYGDIEALQPSYFIQDKINGLNFTPATIYNACACYYQPDNKIWLSVPNGSNSTNNRIFWYDTITKTNEPRGSGINAACLAIYNRQVYHGDYDGQIYNHGTVNSYDGSAISAFWESKWIGHSGISTYKRYKRLVLFAEGEGTADVTLRWGVIAGGQAKNFSTSESISIGDNAWDQGLWDVALWSTGESAIFERKINMRGKAFKLRISNSSSSQLPKIRMIALEYETFGVNRG